MRKQGNASCKQATAPSPASQGNPIPSQSAFQLPIFLQHPTAFPQAVWVTSCGGQSGDGTRVAKQTANGAERETLAEGLFLVGRSYLCPSWLEASLAFFKSLQKHPAWHPTHAKHAWAHRCSFRKLLAPFTGAFPILRFGLNA